MGLEAFTVGGSLLTHTSGTFFPLKKKKNPQGNLIQCVCKYVLVITLVLELNLYVHDIGFRTERKST